MYVPTYLHNFIMRKDVEKKRRKGGYPFIAITR